MRKIGLITDSVNFPSLPLMKISAYHKKKNNIVKIVDNFLETYDIAYISKVFNLNLPTINPLLYIPRADKIYKGGSGYAIKVLNGFENYETKNDLPLPQEIENIYPDYSLYPQYANNTAYGYLTRGCPNNCTFCIVCKKDGLISRKAADLKNFWNNQKNIELLDANINEDGIEFIKELSGGGEAGAGFFRLAPLCVNLGAADGILYDYGFNISEENPAVVTFANGYTKTFKTLASVPDEPVDTNTTIYFGIDENGHIEAFKSIKYADNQPANISSSRLPCLWINTASPIRQTKAKYEEQTEWENKNIVPFAYYKKSGSIATINNYEYNSNGFNDDFSKSITGKSQNCELELIYTNTIELNLSNKFYDLGKTSYDQTYFLKKDVNFPKSGMGIFYLSIYTEQEVIIDIKAPDYSKVKLSGGKIGSLGSGRYLVTLYYNFSNDDTFMMVNCFSEPEADLPPEVES